MNVADVVPELAAIVDEAGGLPPALTAQQIGALFACGTDHVYAQTRAGTWPTPVLKLGRAYRYPTVPALEALGLWPLDRPTATLPHLSAAPVLSVVTS